MIDDLIISWSERKDYEELFNYLSDPNSYRSLRINKLPYIILESAPDIRQKLIRQVIQNAPIWFIEENLDIFDAPLLLERYDELPQNIKLRLLYDVRKNVAEKLVKLEDPEVLIKSTNPYIIKWLSENTDLKHDKIEIYNFFKKFSDKDDIVFIHYFFDDYYYVSLIGPKLHREYLFNITNKKRILLDIAEIDSQSAMLNLINSWARSSLTYGFSYFSFPYFPDEIFSKLLKFDKKYALRYVKEFLPSRVINHNLFSLSIKTILNDEELAYKLLRDHKLREIVWDYIFLNKFLSKEIKSFKYSHLFFESEFVSQNLKKYVKARYHELISSCNPEKILSILRRLYFLSKTVLIVRLPNNSKWLKLVHYLSKLDIMNNNQLINYVYEYSIENDPKLLSLVDRFFINQPQNQ